MACPSVQSLTSKFWVLVCHTHVYILCNLYISFFTTIMQNGVITLIKWGSKSSKTLDTQSHPTGNGQSHKLTSLIFCQTRAHASLCPVAFVFVLRSTNEARKKHHTKGLWRSESRSWSTWILHELTFLQLVHSLLGTPPSPSYDNHFPENSGVWVIEQEPDREKQTKTKTETGYSCHAISLNGA